VRVAANDDFEHRYAQRFREICARYGEFVSYERDRAARDIGLHFTQATASGYKIVTTALVWFQLKGIRTVALCASKLAASETISLPLEVRHLRFWFSLPVPTYLAVYIEAADSFLVINVSRWIEEEFGENILVDDAKTKTIHLNKGWLLDDDAFSAIRNTASLELIEKRLHVDTPQADLFLRDAQIIRSIATAPKRGVEQRLCYIKWISKMRSEVYFEERHRNSTEWEQIRSHWQYAMGDLAAAFLYLSFEAFDEEMDWENLYDPDEIDGEDIHLIGDRRFVGVGGWTGEYSKVILRPALNSIGESWARMLEILESADLLVVDDQVMWVSVAPFHDRGL
jgi:hypothetical protein